MLTGIQAQGLWNERLGFGTNHEGEVVIVEQSSWYVVDTRLEGQTVKSCILLVAFR